MKTILLGTLILVLISCESRKSESIIVPVTDSLKSTIQNIADTIINNTPDASTISGRFIKQDNSNNRLYIQTEKGIIVLNNSSSWNDEDTKKLKKTGDNITVTFSKNDSIVTLMSAQYEQAGQ